MSGRQSEWDFADTILAVLFGLTIEVGLEHGLTPLVDFATFDAFLSAWWNKPKEHSYQFLMLAAFTITLCRFYGGAHRFHSEQPDDAPWSALALDAAWTPVLFLGFYAAAILVDTPDMFLAAVTVFHIIDFGWFWIARRFSRLPPHIHAVLGYYLWYDAITILAVALVGWSVYSGRMPASELPVVTFGILIVMFFIDCYGVTRDWYFAPKQWRKKYE